MWARYHCVPVHTWIALRSVLRFCFISVTCAVCRVPYTLDITRTVGDLPQQQALKGTLAKAKDAVRIHIEEQVMRSPHRHPCA